MTAVRKTRIVAVLGSLGKTTTARAGATALGLPVQNAINVTSEGKHGKNTYLKVIECEWALISG